MISASEKLKLRHVWRQMILRCTDTQNRQFTNYGGRGITVCERWRDFDTFLADMGPRPPGGTIDRIDNNAGYAPHNCRWADRKAQNSNRRNCIYVQDGHERVTAKEYCRRRGLSYRPIMKRIASGWPVTLALHTPIGVPPHSLRELMA